MIPPAQPLPPEARLLDPQFLRKLEQAAIAARHIHLGRTKGERRSARRGSSVEFADYRSYTPGDDLRYLDWNAYARLERLFLKLFLEEEDLHVYVLLDASRSMDFGSPTKFAWATQVAAALAYLALGSGDRVQLLAHAAGEGQFSRMFRGRGSAPEAFTWLAGLRPAGATDLAAAADWLLRTIPAPGIIFVVSDLLAPDWEAFLRRVGAARSDCCVLQVLAPDELQPTMRGDLRLVDAETGEAQEVTMGASAIRRYLAERDRFLEDARKVCHRYGFSHLLSASSDPVETVILRNLRRLGVVR